MTSRKNESSGTGSVEDEIDALFQIPLGEFTGARNSLAARLKQEGRRDEAERVKLLAKPSVSAWAVNQLYWNHRQAFDQLIATGRQFRPAQTSRLVGKAAMRDSLDARREALVHLSDLATALLQDAGHNPGHDTIRRVITMLEALSAYALLPDGPTPGRLSQDLEPPSFESLASLMSAGATKGSTPRKAVPSSTSAREKATGAQARIREENEARWLEESRQKSITAVKTSLQQAKKSLIDARAKAENLKTVQRRADAESKEAEKHRREAEQRLKHTTAVSKNATQRAQRVAADMQQASKAAEDARRMVEELTKELERLLREGPK